MQQVRSELGAGNHTRGRLGKAAVLLILGLFGFLSILFSSYGPKVQAATSSNLNFQARLLNSAGGIVPDGTYNIDFKIYNANGTTGSVGTCTSACLWEETRKNSNSQGVQVINGYFSVNLGSVTSFPAINWDQQLWLTMNIGGTTTGPSPTWDGEMQNSGNSIALTALPYAFVAGQLAATSGAHRGTLGFSTVATDPAILLPDASGTVCLQAAVACGFATSTGGSGYIQNQAATPQSANFNIQSAASGSIGGLITGASGQSVDILQIKANGVSNPLFSVGNTGASTFRNSSNSSSAFQIQNAGGAALFTADTTNSKLNTGGDLNVGTNYGNRLFSDNFEGGSFGLWAGTNSGLTIDSSVTHNGKNSAKVVETGTGKSVTTTINGGATTIDWRMYVNITSFSTVFNLGYVNTSTAESDSTYIDASGHICFFNGHNSTSTCSAGTVSTGAWHLVDTLLTQNGASGSFSITVDGTVMVTATGQSTGTGTYQSFGISDANSSRTATVNFDDVSVDSTTTGPAASLNVSDSFHVGGTTSFGNAVLLQTTSNSTQAFQIQNAAGTSNLFVADTTNSRLGVLMAPTSSIGTVQIASTTGSDGISFWNGATKEFQISHGTGIQAATTGTSAWTNLGTLGSGVDILDLYNSTNTAVVSVSSTGNISTTQSALTAGQTNISQTITNASTSGGTVQGLSQAITVSNTTSASTTQGINIALADNTASSLTNSSTGLTIALSGSNASRSDIGIDVATSRGLGIRSVVSGSLGSNSATRGCNALSIGTGICGGDTGNSTAGAGVYGYSNSRASTNIYDPQGSGVYGLNNASGGSAGAFYAGVKGITTQSSATASTSIGVLGQAKAGTGATAYGGYFTYDSSSTAVLGAVLYVSNSSVAANILQIQDNTSDVLVVGDGGSVSITPSDATKTIVIGSTAETGQITLGQSTDTNTISIGSNNSLASGKTQTINLGTSTGAGSTTNVVVGSTIAGTTTLQSQGGVKVSTATSATANSTYLCRDTSTTLLTVCNTTGTSGIAFLQGGNSFGNPAVLGTNDSNSLTIRTNSQAAATIAVGGAITFQNNTNSTAAFQVQNAVGTGLFNIDDTSTPNLLTNPSIQQAVAGNWVTKISAAVTQDGTQQYIGSKSLKVVTAATADDGAKQAITLSTSTQYSLSFFAKLDGASGAFATLAAGYSSTGLTAGDVNCTLNSTTVVTAGWTHYFCTFTTPGSNSGTPYIYIKQTNAFIHTFYVDAIQLQTGATATAYQDGQIAINSVITSPTTFKNQSDSDTAFQIQNVAGNSLLTVDTLNAKISVGDTGIASSVQIGNTTGAVTQTINIGNNSTASSTTNVNIGSTIAGTTAIAGATTVTGRSTDTGSNTALTVTNGGTGNIAKFFDSASANAVLSIADGGASVFRNQTDGNQAFQVQTSSGSQLINVSTADLGVINNGTSTPGNLLENPGFEIFGGSTGSGWGFGGQYILTTDAANAHTGNRVDVGTPNSVSTSIMTGKYYFVQPGDTYYMEGWVKTAAGTDGSFALVAEFTDKDKLNIVNTLNTQTAAAVGTSYTKVSQTVTIPAGKYYLRFGYSMRSTSTTGTWYFDDGFLQKVNHAEPANFQNSVDSNTAFQVQNAAGSALFNINNSDGYLINNGISNLDNQIENASFESNGTTDATGWFTPSATQVITNNSSNAKSGNNELVVTGNSTTHAVTTKWYAVHPGDQVYAEAWVKNSAAAPGDDGIYLEFADKDKGSSTFSNNDTGVPGTTYVLKSITATVPAGKVYVRIAASTKSTATSGTFYFDDFYMKRINQQAPLTITNVSTAALQVQNSGSFTVLGVDTTNSKIFTTIADGASAIGFTLNTPSYTTAGAKLFSIQNNSSEKLSVSKDGDVSAAGNMNIATGKTYQINGTQITSAALSNDSNLAKLNGTGPQTFTGDNKFTSTVLVQSTSTTAFQVQNASNTIFAVDGSGNKVILGSGGAGTLTANLQFNYTGQTGSIALVPLNPSSTAYTLSLPAETGTLCTSAATSTANCTNFASASTTTTALAGKLNKGVVDTSSAAVTAPQGNLYAFTNTSSGIASGVLKLDNGNNTESALSVVGTVDYASNKAYIYVNNTNVTPTGNLIDLQAGSADKFTVDASGNVSAAGNISIATGKTYQINGVQITSGALSDGANLAKLNGTQTFTGANTFSNAGNAYTGDGANITNINATNIATGTLNDGRLSSNVALLNGTQSFTGSNTFAPTSNNAGQIIRQTSGTATSGNVLDVQTANTTSHFLLITNAAANEGNVTLQSVGATRDLTLNSGSGTIKIPSSTTGIQNTGSTSFTIDVQNGSNSTLFISNSSTGLASLDVEGGINIGATQTYKVNGTQITSANLSNDSDIAKLSGTGPQTFTGNNKFTGTVLLKSSTAAAFQIQQTSTSTNLFAVDTAANTVSIGAPAIFNSGTYSSGSTSTITQSLIDNNTTVQVQATNPSLTFTMPTPTVTTIGRLAYIINTGSNSLTLNYGSGTFILNVSSAATLVYTGTGNVWGSAGTDSSTLQNGYNNSTGSTTPEIKLDPTRSGIDIQDADTTLGSGVSLFTVRGVNGSGLGNSLFNILANGKVGINIGSSSTTPTISNDLSFGQIAGVTTARTIGVEAQGTTNIGGNGLSATAGTGNGTGVGGLLLLQGGTSGTGIAAAGGAVNIFGGNANGSGASNGGNVVISGGTKAGTGAGGSVIIKPQSGNDSSTAVQIQTASGLNILTVDTVLGNINTAVGNLALAGVTLTAAPTLTGFTSGGTLTNATAYQYLVAAVGPGGEGFDYPTNPTFYFTTNATSRISLSWTAVTGATNYLIYRSTDGVNWKVINAGNVTSYNDTSNAAWTVTGTRHDYTATGNLDLPMGGSIQFNPAFSMFMQYAASIDALEIGNFQANSGIALYSDNFKVVDSVGFNTSLSISNTGAALFKNRTNSTSAFQVQSSGSTTPVLNVDTTNNRVGINTATPSASFSINSGTANVSGLQFTQLTNVSPVSSSFSQLLGLDSSGNVGLSSAGISLTSPALAYWDGANNPTTGSQSYPIATVSGTGTGSVGSCTGTWAPAFVSGSGVELTPACNTTSGSINWNFSQVPFEETQFQFKAGGGTHADSTWFYSYADATPTTEYGSGYSQGYIIYFSEYHHCVGIAYGGYTDGNQCNSGGGANPLTSSKLYNIDDNVFHAVDIQIRQNIITVRWDNKVVLTYTDVYTRDLSALNFGFGSRTGGSNNQHFIKGLLVTKLGTNASQYNINGASPLASNITWDNTADSNAGRLGIGSYNPDSTLEVHGTTSTKTIISSAGTVYQGTGNITACTATGTAGYTANTTITGSGTSFSTDGVLIGDTIVLPDGTKDTVLGVGSNTSLTVSTSRLECVGAYKIVRDIFSTAGTTVQIGDSTADATQVDLELDSLSTYADANTCGTTTDQGAMYYNTNTTAIRSCINGSWEDVVTTSGLGILTYGIVPDSGTSPGNLGGISATDASDGPCKVYMGSVNNSVRWNACTVYTQGRKQNIAAQTSNYTTGITTTSLAYQNLCIFTAGSAPTFGTASTTETSATVPSFTPGAPAVCLATIKEKSGGSGIGAIYGTRVFTNSNKTFAAVATAVSPGYTVKLNGSPEQAAPTTATTDPFIGVVAAWSGTTQTTSINAIIVIGGPAFVKATAGTTGQYIRPAGGGTSTGYVNTGALVTVAQTDIPYTYLGISQSTYNAPGTQCSITANADTCRGSLLVDINIR